MSKSFQDWKAQGGEHALSSASTAAETTSTNKPWGGKTVLPYKKEQPRAGSSKGSSVDDIIRMLQAGISEEIVIDKIHQSRQIFNLSTDDMIALKKAGATNNLIKTMMQNAAPVPTTPAGSLPSATAETALPVSGKSGPALSPGHGVVQRTDLDRLNNGTVRMDLNAIRLNPAMLENKSVMQYFIGLNNCQNRDIERALQNELDYPALAKYYRENAAAILAALPDTAGLALFRGNNKGGVLWGKAFGGYDRRLRTLALGDYDTERHAFPFLVSDKSKSFQVYGNQHSISDRQSLDKSCPVAYDEMIWSGDARTSLPSAYNISFPAMTFDSLSLPEAAARTYIDSMRSSTSRAVYLGTDVHLTSLTAPSASGEMDFSGTIARIFVFNTSSGEIVGMLYDDHSLASPVIKKAPTALTTMTTPDDINVELSTAVYVSLASDYCGWPLDPQQKENLRRFMDDINAYGNFNQRYKLNAQIGHTRQVLSSHAGFCRVPQERAAYEKDAATLWPKGRLAAPAN